MRALDFIGEWGKRFLCFLKRGHVKVLGEGDEVVQVAGEEFRVAGWVKGDFEDGRRTGAGEPRDYPKSGGPEP